MKKIIYLLSVSLFGFALLNIPSAFTNMNFIHRQMHKVLNLRIRDSFNGGKKLFRFTDPLGDDNGNGELEYPRSELYKGGVGLMDILSFTIFSPQSETDWSDDIIYWQFSYRLKNLNSGNKSNPKKSPQIINHYFGFEGEEGRTDTLYPRSELVRFDPEYPWQYAVSVDVNSETAKIFSYDDIYSSDITMMVDKELNKIVIRVPLNYKPLRKIFTNPTTYHYVLSGGYDPLTNGNFLPVKKRSSIRNGGGAKSRLTPKVYDYLTPKGYSQKSILESYSEETFEYALLKPIIADPKDLAENKKNSIPDKFIEEFKAALQEENKLSREKKEREVKELEDKLKNSGELKSNIELGIKYFNLGNTEKSEEIILNYLDKNPEDPRAISYYGSIMAMKGGQTDSLSQAMEYIYKAFDLYKKAIKLVKTPEEELEVRLNRANVAKSVPESVFQKNTLGAKDFLKAAEIYKEIYPDKPEYVAHCYIMAALCFKNAGKEEESIIYLEAAESSEKINSTDRYKLLLNGYGYNYEK